MRNNVISFLCLLQATLNTMCQYYLFLYNRYYIFVRKMSIKASMVVHTYNPSPPEAMAMVLLWVKATISYTGRARPVKSIHMAHGKKEEEKERENSFFFSVVKKIV